MNTMCLHYTDAPNENKVWKSFFFNIKFMVKVMESWHLKLVESCTCVVSIIKWFDSKAKNKISPVSCLQTDPNF